jgi:PAS domain S-box-containing protein
LRHLINGANGLLDRRRNRLPHRQLVRLAWIPVPLLLAAIIAAREFGSGQSHESRALMLVLSFTFYTLVSLGTLFLFGRSFLASGAPGLLLLECGVILWSLAGTLGDAVSHGDANLNVTIFNTGILLAGLCHLAGAILSLRPPNALRARRLWLGIGWTFALGLLWLVTHAARAGWLPVYFVPGHGGTPVRYGVLISAITMFVLAAGLLYAGRREVRSAFTSWYAWALLLLAVGLFGVMIQLSLGSLVNWLGRTAQWLGGVYLLAAAVTALRESQQPLFSIPAEGPHSARYRYAVAVVVVLAAASVRLAFLSAMGSHAPYVIFYPALVVAAFYGGWGAGIVATVLSALIAAYFWVPPAAGHLAVADPAGWLSLTIFLLSGVTVVWVTEALHHARSRALAAETRALLSVEREAARDILRESEARYRTLFTGMSEGFLLCELLCDEAGLPYDYRYLEINPAYERLTGLSASQIVGRTARELLPDGESLRIEEYSRVVLTGKPVRFEQYNSETGRHWEQRSFSTGHGGFAVLITDITERKSAEAVLQSTLNRFYTVLSGMYAAILLVTDEGRVEFANQALCDQFGLNEAPADLVGLTSEAMLEKVKGAYSDPKTAADRIRDILERGEPVAGEELFMRGGKTALRDFVPLIVNGKSRGRLWLHVDITARKRSEEALAESRAKLEAALASMTDAVFISDVEGRFVDFNEAFATYHRFRNKDECAKTFAEYPNILDLFMADGTPAPLDMWAVPRALRGETVADAEYTLRRKDTGETWIGSYSFGPIRGPDGAIVGSVVSCRDITSYKLAEQALRRAHDELELRVAERTAELLQTVNALEEEVSRRTAAEQALRERSDKLRAMASELIMAEQRERQRLAQLLHDGLQQLLVAARFRLAAMDRALDPGARAVAGEVSDLLSDAVAASRSLTAELSPPILREGGLVAALEWVVRWMQDKHQLTVHLEAPDRIPVISEDVTVLLFHAARELLFNVVKHAGVKTARVQVDQTDGSIQVTVEDEGAGFDATGLFDAGGVPGGIGLFSIRERTHLLGGHMEIDSAPGRGSRFTLKVPLAACDLPQIPADSRIEASAVNAPSTAAAEAAGAIRVVLVDDHIVMREGLAGLLRGEPDITVVGEASDGESGVAVVRQVHPDVVLMDLSMPGMSGIEATRLLQVEMPEVRVIGLSMFEQADRAEAMRRAGAVDYVTKSGPADALLAAIRRWAHS